MTTLFKRRPLNFLLSSRSDLQIIPEEEDEPRLSSSSSSSKRRPEIRIAKTPIPDDDDDNDNCLLAAPRPAPRPPCSPASSQDSFQLTFTNESFKFPHPPLPTPSSSDRYFSSQSPMSSPSSDSSALPLTPTSSDDEEFQPPRFISRRVSIRPLTIVKNDALPSMFTSSPHDLESNADSDSESDSEWYNRELSQSVTLRSAFPANFPTTVKSESARPESMIGSVHSSVSPVSSTSSAFPSPQLDPTYPKRRFLIPSRPPPPPPRDSLVPSPVVSEDDDVFLQRPVNPEPRRRPPPRMSIPADFDFFPEDAESDEEDDDNVLTYYVEAADSTTSASSGSFYSQPSHIERFSISDLEQGEFQFALDTDIDRPIMLPLSLPNTPIDLEADIASGLAELHMRREADAPVDVRPVSASLTRSASASARRQMRRNMVVSVPIEIDWNLSEEEEAAADEAREQVASQDAVHSIPAPPPTEEKEIVQEEPLYEDHVLDLETTSPALRSRWSSSTLGSIREDQQSRGWRTSKLRLYFGGSKKRSNSITSGLLSPVTPTTPSKSKVDITQKARNKKRAVVVVGPPSSVSASSGWSYGSSAKVASPSSLPSSASITGPMSPYYDYSSRSPPSRMNRQTGSDDMMVIGHGHHPDGAGVRRRGSTSTSRSSAAGSGASDTSSILSGSSSASSGLRRKPIPVEMFLRA